MAVQIKNDQIKDSTIEAGKIKTSAGTFDFSSGSAVLRASAPSGSSDVATKQYVDNVAAGLHFKESARLAPTGNISLTGTQTIDGVAAAAGDRILVMKQTDQTENGVYVCAAGGWSRSSDMDAGSEFPAAALFVREGTTNGDIPFVCTNDAVTLGSTNIAFTQFNGASSIVAGAGLAKSGNELSVNVDDSTLEINSDALRLKDGGIVNDKIANGTIAAAKLAGSIGDSLLSTITTADKVSGSAVQLNGSGGLSNSTGLQISAGGVTNAMLAGSIASSKLVASTISGIALGSNLADLTIAGSGGLKMSGSYNGSTARSVKLDIDGLAEADAIDMANDSIALADASDSDASKKKSIATLVTGMAGNGLSASSGVLAVGVDDSTVELNSDALRVKDSGISTAKIADTAVTIAKIGFKIRRDAANGDGSKVGFDLGRALNANQAEVLAYRNGVLLEQVSSSPSGTDEYTVSAAGGTGGVGLVTFGSAPAADDRLNFVYLD